MKRTLYPPHWVVLMIGAELALHRWLPLWQVIPAPARWAGIALMVVGLGIGGWAAALFRRKKTGLKPFADATAVVEAGPYRFTRNPMYLGMVILLLGLAVLLGSLTPFAAPILFAPIIHYRFILPEEEYMERTLGEPYRALKGRVRRWL
jgi:protein-S-isoprenylcysteine O-methyltransferase Ste14